MFQALFGLLRLGSLIKFAPHPVMAGFQNMAAVLLFLVQLGNVLGFDRNVSFTRVFGAIGETRPLSVLVAALTFVAMWNARRITTKMPPLLVGLGCGIVAYYALALAGLGDMLGPIIGPPTAARRCAPCWSIFPGSRWPESLEHSWLVIVSGALALAIIASIDALLCAKLDQPARRASRRRRPPADPSRHRQCDVGRLWRHHQRHQYRAEPRSIAPSAGKALVSVIVNAIAVLLAATAAVSASRLHSARGAVGRRSW